MNMARKTHFVMLLLQEDKQAVIMLPVVQITQERKATTHDSYLDKTVIYIKLLVIATCESK